MRKASTPLGFVVSMVLFALAIWFLWRTTAEYDFSQVLKTMLNVPPHILLFAAFLSAISYAILVFYDVLAFHYLWHPLSYRSIVFASFICQAFTNNIGLSVVSASSVRFRLYSSFGLTNQEVVKVIAFCNLTFTLGFLCITGLLFLLQPFKILRIWEVHPAIITIAGLICLALVLGYLFLGAGKEKTLKIGTWHFAMPSLNLCIWQLAVSSVEWITTAGILFVLIPGDPMPFAQFLGIFLIAHLAGLGSNVPGGLGVFEAVLLLFTADAIRPPDLIGAIVLYRVLYYFLPFLISVVLYLVFETQNQTTGLLGLKNRILRNILRK